MTCKLWPLNLNFNFILQFLSTTLVSFPVLAILGHISRLLLHFFFGSKGGAMVRGLASQQSSPGSNRYVGWVCCWFSPLPREVFLRVLRFSPLFKNQHFQITMQLGTSRENEEPLSGCATFKSWFIYLLFWSRLPKTVFFFAQKKVLRRKQRKKSPVTCLTWKLKTVRIPRKMKNFMFPPGIKLKKERIVLKLFERWS